MRPFETYLKEMSEIRSSGEALPEVPYYGALEKLFNEIGKTLKPKVRCVISIKNRGAGLPDGGFFTADQLGKRVKSEVEPEWAGQLPSRGVLEVKSAAADAWEVARDEQVARYWAKYGQVLVTNYRDFILIGRDARGRQALLESYCLAESESDFWAATAHPRKTRDAHERRFTEYLLRVMLSASELRLPENLAWLLASYARDAKERIEGADLSDLNDLRDKLQAVLGITFGGEEGESFFRSTLIQTIFYGIFAAWVLWSRDSLMNHSEALFDWRVAGFELRVPIVKKLFEEVATSSTLEALQLIEVLNWTGAALNRVNREDFFRNFDETHAVQYFYEPFLEAFDPVLRKNLGVWYTPPEIVTYMVERVDQVLREELEEPEGLASSNVYVLDPGCGTGAYLVEVLRRIERTLREKGEDALIAEEIKNAAINRVLGFEILPASFVISHLEISSFLASLNGVRFSAEERPAIYLTNALTGWEKIELPTQLVTERGFKQEWEAATKVKRDTPILVVIGNPPYNAFAGVSPDEEAGLVEPYKEGLIDEWGIKKFNLDDLYVRFFRLAERRIAEMTGRGIVCFVSNFSYLGDPSFVVMRQSLLHNFDKFWFDCMNGDSRETGKLTPEGKPDPSVFSTQYNRAGITVGTVISLMAREKHRPKEKSVLFRHFWGRTKKTDLLKSLKTKEVAYEPNRPNGRNRYSFRPFQVDESYWKWPSLIDLSELRPSNGLMEKRHGALVDTDRQKLERRMRIYFDRNVDWNSLKHSAFGLTENAARFDAQRAREKILEAEKFEQNQIVPYIMRPFDTRWCYYSAARPLWNEPRPGLWAQCWQGNHFLVSRFKAAKDREGSPFYFIGSLLCDDHLLTPDAYCFPERLRNYSMKRGTQEENQHHLVDVSETRANLSDRVRQYLQSFRIPDFDSSQQVAAIVWMHALAIGYCPQYLNENRDGIAQDWPRIPLPNSARLLRQSAEMGQYLAALLNTEEGVSGVTLGPLRAELKTIAAVSHAAGKKIDASSGDLDVTAGWGHLDRRGATMPGQGMVVEREYDPVELLAIEKGAATLGLSLDQTLGLLGETTLDVFMNDTVYWRNVPLNVWEYRIGGYQVIKKWLSYREKKVLGRALSVQEARDVTDVTRRLAAIVLLQPQLNRNYEKIKRSLYTWGGVKRNKMKPAESAPSASSRHKGHNQISLPLLLATRE